MWRDMFLILIALVGLIGFLTIVWFAFHILRIVMNNASPVYNPVQALLVLAFSGKDHASFLTRTAINVPCASALIVLYGCFCAGLFPVAEFFVLEVFGRPRHEGLISAGLLALFFFLAVVSAASGFISQSGEKYVARKSDAVTFSFLSELADLNQKLSPSKERGAHVAEHIIDQAAKKSLSHIEAIIEDIKEEEAKASKRWWLFRVAKREHRRLPSSALHGELLGLRKKFEALVVQRTT
jgi:hypothetical protein